MATVNLGRVGLVLKGDWDSATAYVPLDVVSHDGNSWAAKRNNTNVEPTTENYDDWQLISNNSDLVATVQGYKEDAETAAGSAAQSAADAETSAQSITTVIAPAEASSTASAPYAVGEYFIYNGKLYAVTAAIAQGGTITPGTNCEELPDGISGEVSDLKSAIDDTKNALGYVPNLFEGVTWERGGISAKGSNANSNTRVRCAERIPTESGITYTISCTSGYVFYVVGFVDAISDGTNIYNWGTSFTFTGSDSIKYIRVQVRKEPEGSDTADVDAYSSALSATNTYKNDGLMDKVNSLEVSYSEVVTQITEDESYYDAEAISPIADLQNQKNLVLEISGVEWTNGKLDNATGEGDSDNTWIKSGFIARENIYQITADNTKYTSVRCLYYNYKKAKLDNGSIGVLKNVTGAKYIRLCFANGGAVLTPDYAEQLNINYVYTSDPIIKRMDNAESDIGELNENVEYLLANPTGERDYVNQVVHSQIPAVLSAIIAPRDTNLIKSDNIIIDVTDLHGEYLSLSDAGSLKTLINTLHPSYSELINIICTGDVFRFTPKDENGNLIDDVETYMSIAKQYCVYHCIGQHEVGWEAVTGNVKALCMTHQEVFDTFIAPMKTVWGLPNLNTVYYYKDFTAAKTRLISLYQFDMPLIDDPNDATKYKYNRATLWYSQNQIDWLINTLNSVPSDYNVVIMSHLPVGMIKSTNDNNFYTKQFGSNGILNGALIPDIVNAYINRTTLVKTYHATDTDTYPTDPFEIDVDADFSSASGTFVNYYSGDAHIDGIGKIEGGSGQSTSIQRAIGLTASSTTCYDCNVEIYNGGRNANSGIVNALSYDYTAKKIRLARLGQQYSQLMGRRDVALLEYFTV